MTEIVVATPMYNGMCYGLYVRSMFGLQKVLNDRGIPMWFMFDPADSLIQTARNSLVDEFMTGGRASHLLFIDADVAFDPYDIIKLLDYDKDVIALPGGKKSIDWENVKVALQNHPEMDAQSLQSVIGSFVYAPVEGQSPEDEIIEVTKVGGHCMLIKREVFDKLRDDCETYFQRSTQRQVYDYFGCTISDNEVPSEVYSFCRRWRNSGGQIYVCPQMRVDHIGQYTYEGNLGAINHFVGNRAQK